MSQSPVQRFIAELRRRHVPQTAAIYLVAAWAAIEFSDVVVPNLNGPQWIVTAVIVAAGVGFPVVLILAWMFDWGPEGVERTGPTPEHPGTGTPTGPRPSPWLAVIAVLVVGIGSALAGAALLSDGGDGGAPASEATEPDPSADARPGSRAPETPPRPGLVAVDSLGNVLRGLEGAAWEGLAEFRELEALGALGESGLLDDSALAAIGERARQALEAEDHSVVIQEPRNWMMDSGIPVSLAEGDTLRVMGVALDTAGVVAVLVDGQTVARADPHSPTLPFEAWIVGRPVMGLRDIPVVVRTADGRELRTVYWIATPMDPNQ